MKWICSPPMPKTLEKMKQPLERAFPHFSYDTRWIPTGYHWEIHSLGIMRKRWKWKWKYCAGLKGGSWAVEKVVHMWFKCNIPPLLHCHKKMGTRTPSFTRHDFFFFCPARNYPKRDWELVLRVGLVTGVEPAVGSVLDPGLWEVGLCGGTQWEAPCSAAHDHSESHRTRISTRISRP